MSVCAGRTIEPIKSDIVVNDFQMFDMLRRYEDFANCNWQDLAFEDGYKTNDCCA